MQLTKLEQVFSSHLDGLRLLLSERSDAPPLRAVLKGQTAATVALAIGPEGGWTPQEQETFGLHHFESVTLGSNILRAETAAIVVAAILRYELGNS